MAARLARTHSSREAVLLTSPKLPQASNRNNIVSFKGRQFANKGARALRDVPWGGSHTGKLPIQLLSALAIISKSFAVFNFDSALRVRVLPRGAFLPLTVAGFAVGDSLDVEDGVAAHPKTNPARNRRLKRRNAGEQKVRDYVLETTRSLPKRIGT
jgi:hypothetical protein